MNNLVNNLKVLPEAGDAPPARSADQQSAGRAARRSRRSNAGRALLPALSAERVRSVRAVSRAGDPAIEPVERAADGLRDRRSRRAALSVHNEAARRGAPAGGHSTGGPGGDRRRRPTHRARKTGTPFLLLFGIFFMSSVAIHLIQVFDLVFSLFWHQISFLIQKSSFSN